MAVSTLKSTMEEALMLYIQKKLDDVFDEELDQAIERIRDRRAEILAGAAARIVRSYEINTDRDNLVITVKELK